MPSDPTTHHKARRGYLVKVVWTILILAIGSMIQVFLSDASGKQLPFVGMLMGVLILGVWTWKPRNPDKYESAIQPLDKKAQDEE